MKFENKTNEKILLRYTLGNGKHYFKNIKPEEVIELEGKMGDQALRVGLEPVREVKVVESSIGKKKVETKQISPKKPRK